MTDIITHELLKSWNPCANGYKRFCELFPNGADLETAINGLVTDNHDDWGEWLFNACKERNLFNETTLKGYRNSGYGNSGDYNSGDRNSGYGNSGNYNSGYGNSGDGNSGKYNSGYGNSGNYNSGEYNSGDYNSGYGNSGKYNSGYGNSGNYNSGNYNSGNYNSGYRNSGNYNSGDYNSGYFNIDTPKIIRVFGKETLKTDWEKADKPNFILEIELNYWVDEKDMSDEDKKLDPNFYVRGGQLRRRDYKEAWLKAWNEADIKDREKIKNIPNFDKDMFFQISGIKVD